MDHDFINPTQADNQPSGVNPGPIAPDRPSWQHEAILETRSDAVPATTDTMPTTPSQAPSSISTMSNEQPWSAAAETPYTPNIPTQPTESYFSTPEPSPTQVMPPSTPTFASPTENQGQTAPLAVVEVVSVRGVEYAMMTLTLWVGSFSLLGVLLSLINGSTTFGVLAFPASSLIVCLPVFGFFFLRLKKAELMNPSLKLDPSKRRFTQFTQLVAFAACLFTLIAFVFYILTKISGEGGTSAVKATLDVAAVLAVAGGILAYYWIDEHRER